VGSEDCERAGVRTCDQLGPGVEAAECPASCFRSSQDRMSLISGTAICGEAITKAGAAAQTRRAEEKQPRTKATESMASLPKKTAKTAPSPSRDRAGGEGDGARLFEYVKKEGSRGTTSSVQGLGEIRLRSWGRPPLSGTADCCSSVEA